MIRKAFTSFTGIKYIALILISTVSSFPIIGQNGNKTENVRILDVHFGNARNELWTERDKSPLICTHFESTCSERDTAKCYYNKTCSGENEVCFTTWTGTNENQYKNSENDTRNIRDPSGHNVKNMGCMPNHDAKEPEVNQNNKCEATCQTTHNPKHKHFYCCCTGKDGLPDNLNNIFTHLQ